MTGPRIGGVLQDLMQASGKTRTIAEGHRQFAAGTNQTTETRRQISRLAARGKAFSAPRAHQRL